MAPSQLSETTLSRQSLRRAFRWAGFGAAGLAGLFLLAFLCFQIPFVQRVALETALNGLVGTYGFNAQVERAGGLWPWDITASRLRLADNEGEFAEISEIELRLRPLALFGGRIVIDRLALGEGTYLRQPLRSPRGDKSFRIPTLPGRFDPGVEMSVSDISVGPIAILAGDAPVTLSGGGQIQFDEDGLAADISFNAGEAGHADLQALVDAAGRSIEATIEIVDPQGRWLAPLTPLAPGTPLSAALHASGPQHDVAFEAAARWGGARLQFDGAASWRGTLDLDFAGTLENAMPPREQDWAGTQQSFAAEISVAQDGAITIDRVAAVARAAEAHLTGRLAEEINLRGEITVTDSGVLSTRLGLQGLEVAGAEINISGTPDSPMLNVTSRVSRLALAELAVTNADFEIQALVTRQGRTADIEIASRAANISGSALPEILSSSAVDFAASARAEFDRERIEIGPLTANWGPLALTGNGELSGERPMQFEGTLAATDLAAMDSRLAGTVRIVGAARRSRQGGPLEITVDSETSGFNAAGELAALVGPAPRLALEARITDDLAEVQLARLDLAAATAQMEGTFDRIRSISELSGNYSIDDLSALPIGISGAVSGDIEFGGPLTAPELSVTAASPALQSGGVEARAVTLRLNDTGDGGAVSLSAIFADSALTAEIPYERAGRDVLGNISLLFAGLDARGPVAFENGTPRADIHAEADDIAPLVAVLRAYGGTTDALRTHGALSADFAFTGRKGSLSLLLADPSISGINLPAGAERIGLTAALDLEGAPSLDGRLTAYNARFGPSRFSVIDAKAQGPLANLESSLSLRGPATDPFRLDIEAVRREAGAGSDVELVLVSGQSLDVEVDLAEGGHLDVGPSGIALAPTRFNVRNLATGREGTLGAEAHLWTGSPFAAITAQNVPAGALAVFGLPVDWTGELSGSATLDARGGTRPLSLAFTATGLTNDPDIAPLDARLTAEATRRVINAELTLTDTATEMPLLIARSEMPLAWRTGQFAPSVDWGAPIEGELRADAPLERLWLFVPVDTMSVSGALNASVVLGGMLDAPSAQGEARLTGGALEHFRTGLLLRNAEGTFSFTESGDVAADLRATDGNGGNAHLRGTAHLPRDENWEIDGTLALDSLILARRDELRAVASGSLGLVGTLAEARLEGDITLDRVDAQIPSQLPPSVVDLPVVRVSDGEPLNGQRLESGNGDVRRLRLPIDLDVNVNVPRRAFVRGRGLDSEWAGALHVGGNMRTPQISGTLSVVRGTFDLSRTRFDVTQGEIRFLGGDRIDPAIRAEAQAPGPEFTSIIRATGRARQPIITVSSDPAMPEETVMAQILFGKRFEELTAFELVQIAEAMATLTGSEGMDLLGSARRATGLDVLSIGARETTSGGQDVDVTVGRYVAPNVFLGARRGLEPGSGAVTVEMEVTDDITVDAEVRQDSEGSIGVDWRRDY